MTAGERKMRWTNPVPLQTVIDSLSECEITTRDAITGIHLAPGEVAEAWIEVRFEGREATPPAPDETAELKARIERAEAILLGGLGRSMHRVIDDALLVLRGQK